ncbi:MAG: EVE domain-containing protein [Myxococcales bacterium]|nr:EVE domain-containing protein [Myxococcales bacterium]USN49802.1 MAG: EVE domain-containing protein [Myxococcales bacterium]
MTSYWIIKSEPHSYSFQQLEKDKITVWDGVRNYQARNNLQAMKIGDKAFFYHSVGPKEIVGIAKVIKTAYPDPTTKENAWCAVDVEFQKYLTRPVKLSDLKSVKELTNLSLLRQVRLSVCPISKDEWDRIIRLSQEY